MTCGDVEQLLDPFLDAELPSPTMLALARHAAGCAGCDAAIQRLATLRERVASTIQAEVDRLDLTGIWPAVSAATKRIDDRRALAGRLRAWPAWAAGLALAAGMVLFLRSPTETPRDVARPGPQRIASRSLPNTTYIDRLAGKDVRVRREPKAGTTIIWVNYPIEEVR